MARLLAVLATTGALLFLIVGSLGLLPRQTDAGGLIARNSTCGFNYRFGPTSGKGTAYFAAAASFDNPLAITLTETRFIAPFDWTDETTGNPGHGVVRVTVGGQARLQLNQPSTAAFPVTRTISSTLTGPGTVFSGDVIDDFAGGSAFTGSAVLTLAQCANAIDP